MKTLKDFNVVNKRVLVRCDFNVPLSEKGRIGDEASASSSRFASLRSARVLDDFRIRQTIPTISYLVKKGARVILISHLGKPENRELRYSLKPVALRLEKLLKKGVHPVKSCKAGPSTQGVKCSVFNRVKFLDDCIGEKVKRETEKMKPGEIILLENLRFYKEEKENEKNFTKELASLADIYINDAFSVCHRAHASIVGVIKLLPAGAGFLLEKEIEILTKVVENPKLPLVAIFGGKDGNFKAIDKISEKADFVLINWLIEKEIKEKNIKLKYPEKIIKTIDESKKGLDIGKKTILLFKEKIFQAKTIFWSGPLGQIEKKDLSKGTETIAKAIIKSRAFSVVGGGDTINFINKLGLASKFSYLSTGGNAMLEFLSGEELSGIEVLG